MAISWVTGGVINDGGSATANKAVTLPATLQGGDVVWFVLGVYQTTYPTVTVSATGTTPSIQGSATSQTVGSTHATSAIYKMVAAGTVGSGSSDASTVVTFACSGSPTTAYFDGAYGVWRGADTTHNPDLAPSPTVTSGTSATAPSGNTNYASEWAVYMAAMSTASTSLSANPGTLRESNTGQGALCDSNGSVGASGTSVGGGTFSTGSTCIWSVWTITLVPLGGAASVSGVTATMTLAAPAGSVTVPGAVTGAVAALTLAAPAGSVATSSGVTGAVAGLTLAAPAGSVSAGATVAGVTATMSLTAPAGTASGPSTVNFINAWTDASTNEYGLRVIPVANTTGNALVAFIGWNAASGVNPVASVADDAHNWWIPLATSSASGTVRCSIWIAPNARAAKYVSVSLKQWVGGVSTTIGEGTNLPQWAQLDVAAVVGFNNSTTTQSLSATAGGADVALGVAVVGNVNETVSSTGGGSWTTLSSLPAVQSSGSGTTHICPVWSTQSAGAVSESWSVGSTAPMASAMVLLTRSPATPPQPNTNWPGVKVEIGFGYSPGDPTQTITWTDVSSRARQPDGSAIFTSTRGRSYELATPEAGQLTVWLDNHDGAFDPLNAASPYWPNVRLQVPIRISGTWAGTQYPIAFGYVSGWPQQWPDPQWGFSPVTAVDSMGVLSNVTMYSAYSSEVLIDAPYAYFPLGEYYDEANGEPFNNLAFTNQRPAIGLDGVSTTPNSLLTTGQTLGLYGDSATGTGQSGLTGTQTGTAGLVYEDPNFPQYTATNGLTLEFWSNLPTPSGSATSDCLLQLYGDQPNYLNTVSTTPFTPPLFSVNVNTLTGPFCTFGDITGDYDVTGGTYTVPADGNPHHHCLILTGATHPTVNYYLDGALLFTYTSTVTASSNVRYMVMGPSVCLSYFSQATTENYILGHVAAYNYQLDAARIAKHWYTGLKGSNGDTMSQRFGKVLAWGRAYIPKASGLSSMSPLMGYADNMATRSIADVLGDITTADQGIVYADAAGNATYKSRQSLYNQPPKWIFGDWVGDPLNSNWSLTGGLAGWSAFGGTSTFTWAPAFFYSGYPSGLFTPDGVTAFPGFQSAYTPVTAGTSYTFSAVAYSPPGYSAGWFVQALWYNASFGSVGTSTSSAIPIAAATETALTLTATAPAGATQCLLLFFANNTPSAGSYAYFALPMIQPAALAGQAGEIPYLVDESFSFDNTYLYNQIFAQRVISQSQTAQIGTIGVDPQVYQQYGANAAVHDGTSEYEYLPRNALSVSLETSSDEDVYDWANWNLTKYKQPTFRVATLTLDSGANPNIWPIALGLEQGDIVQVNRRPVGGPVYAVQGIIQSIDVTGGPSNYQVKLTISPYTIESGVLQLGNANFDSVTTNRIAW